MRCNICDRELPKPNFNRLHGDIDPCFTCLEVIRDVFPEDTDDKSDEEIEPTADELLAASEPPPEENS